MFAALRAALTRSHTSSSVVRTVTSDAHKKPLYKLKNKNAAKKRYIHALLSPSPSPWPPCQRAHGVFCRLRVTARGDIKYFPSYLRGDSKKIVKSRARALEKQLPKLLPNRTRLTRAYRRTGPSARSLLPVICSLLPAPCALPSS